MKFTTEKTVKITKGIKYSIYNIRTEKNQFRGWNYKLIHLNVKVDLPYSIIGTYVLLLTLANNGISLKHYSTFPKTQIELFKSNREKTITVRAREPIVNFVTFNDRTENFDVKSELHIIPERYSRRKNKDLTRKYIF